MARSGRLGRPAARGIWLCAGALLMLAGCGGGGTSSSGSSPPPGAPPPAAPPPSSNGTATVNWTPPTGNEDGSALTDLAGYHILLGTSQDALDQTIEIDNPGLSTYMVENLAPGTWYFGVKAYARSGSESALSNIASKTIR